MNLKKLSIEELEDMSFMNMAYNILKYENKPQTTAELFKEICNLLKFSKNKYQDLIGDFYASLVVDKRFAFIEGNWNLKEKTLIKEYNDDTDDIDDIDIIEDEEEEEKIPEEDEEIIDEEVEEEEDEENEENILFEEEDEEDEENEDEE